MLFSHFQTNLNSRAVGVRRLAPRRPLRRGGAAFAGVLIVVAVVVCVFGAPGCSAVAEMSESMAAKTAQSTIAGAQADTRAIGANLTTQAQTITTQAQGVRRDSADAPPLIRDAVANRADAIVAAAAQVGAQAQAVDPGITRQLETLAGQVKTLEGERDTATTKAKTLEGQLEEARDYGRWVPFLLLGVVIGGMMLAAKAYPPLAHFPGEIGIGVIGGCLLGLLYVHLQGRYPAAVAIAGGVVLLALIAPTVWRLNRLQAGVA